MGTVTEMGKAKVKITIIVSIVLLGLAGSIGGLRSLSPPPAYALDPPHDSSNSIGCDDCHIAHAAPGDNMTQVAGNANLCQSCHTSGAPASAYPMNNGDMALPGTSGTSHRFDSGVDGWVKEENTANGSTGLVDCGGAYIGATAKIYTITIASDGDVGVATFDWTGSGGTGGSDTGVLTGTDVALNEGITVSFTDGTSPSFKTGDEWKVYARPDLNNPTNTEMSARLFDGDGVSCSTCHDQHKQTDTPFDPAAVTYKHFQRIPNDTAQMCKDCHSVRDMNSVRAYTGNRLSHPVGVPIPVAAEFHSAPLEPNGNPQTNSPRYDGNGTGDTNATNNLILDASGNVQCLTCHSVHYADSDSSTVD